jgi:hypothetical protein
VKSSIGGLQSLFAGTDEARVLAPADKLQFRQDRTRTAVTPWTQSVINQYLTEAEHQSSRVVAQIQRPELDIWKA